MVERAWAQVDEWRAEHERRRNAAEMQFRRVVLCYSALPDEMMAQLGQAIDAGEECAVGVAFDWLEEHGVKSTVEGATRLFRPMTAREMRLARLLGRCRFAPATFDKRFARQLSANADVELEGLTPEERAAVEPRITPRGAECLLRLAHKYRKQIARLEARP